MSAAYSFTNNLFCFTLEYKEQVVSEVFLQVAASPATVGKTKGTSSVIFELQQLRWHFHFQKTHQRRCVSTLIMGVVTILLTEHKLQAGLDSFSIEA